jgi:hypothetical protein
MQPTPQKVKKLKAISTEFKLNGRNKLRLQLISKQDSMKQKKRKQPPRKNMMTSKRKEEHNPLRPEWTQANMTHQQVNHGVSGIELTELVDGYWDRGKEELDQIRSGSVIIIKTRTKKVWDWLSVLRWLKPMRGATSVPQKW